MKRLKTFGKYILLVVAFYIFSTILSMAFISTTYSDMEKEIYSDNNITVKIDEAKSTFVNGYVKGNITNNTETEIQSKYIKIELLSKKENRILSKYIQVDELKPGETKEFTVNFRAENIKYCNVSIVDEYVYEGTNVHLINIKDAENEKIEKISIITAAVILLKYVIL